MDIGIISGSGDISSCDPLSVALAVYSRVPYRLRQHHQSTIILARSAVKNFLHLPTEAAEKGSNVSSVKS